MRKFNNNKKINQIISKIFRNNKLDLKLKELQVIDVWDELIGKSFKKYITESRIKGKTLVVKLKSSSLRNELSYQKSDIINKINEQMGEECVTEIELK